MQTQSIPSSQPPRSGGGKHSCLIALLIIAGVVIVLGGGLAGLAYLVGSDSGPSFGQGIGVIELKGVITESESVLKTLVGFRRNKNVKAIILRIDSPGGGVAGTPFDRQFKALIAAEQMVRAA